MAANQDLKHLDDGIKTLAARINASVLPEEALKFSQSALNLAHTKATLEDIERQRKP